MAVETYYTLTIGGAVNIPFGDQTVQDRWRLVFGNKPSNDERPELSLEEAKVADDDWPAGFLRPNVPPPDPRVLSGATASRQVYPLEGKWEIYEWEIGAQPGADGAYTRLTFVAKAEFEGNGGIDDHKESQKRDAEWFFEHYSKLWHQTLRGKLAGFNKEYEGKLIEPARFRGWEFYCGNGGGGGD